MSKATQDIIAEREKQRRKWSEDHDDDNHGFAELAEAASHLAEPDEDINPDDEHDEDLGWAVRLKARHAGNRRQQLVIAAALLVAEIERLDRTTAPVDAAGRLT